MVLPIYVNVYACLLLPIVFGSVCWVALDARGEDRPVGRVIGWVLGTLLLWVIVFPCYAMVRRDPERQSKLDVGNAMLVLYLCGVFVAVMAVAAPYLAERGFLDQFHRGLR